MGLNPSNKIKIRREIEGNINKYFYKPEYTKISRSFSKDRKKELSIKK